MQTQHYDLIVIGAGSGGLAVAEKAAQFGKQVAVIEAARNLAGLDGAQSTEFDRGTPHPVIALITDVVGFAEPQLPGERLDLDPWLLREFDEGAD